MIGIWVDTRDLGVTEPQSIGFVTSIGGGMYLSVLLAAQFFSLYRVMLMVIDGNIGQVGCLEDINQWR